MKTLITNESKKYGSLTVTPKQDGNMVWFNFNNRGGNAGYNLITGEFVNVRGRVGRRQESWIEANFIATS
jgi:hypothetical protein